MFASGWFSGRDILFLLPAQRREEAAGAGALPQLTPRLH